MRRAAGIGLIVAALAVGLWWRARPSPAEPPRAAMPKATRAPPPAAPAPPPVLEQAPAVDTGAPDVPDETVVRMAEEAFDAGDLAAAERLYAALLDREPDGAYAKFALYKLAGLAHARGDLDQAIVDMERVLAWDDDLAPADDPVGVKARGDLERLYDEKRARVAGRD